MTLHTVRILLGLTVAVIFWGCSGKKEVEWKEEVRLSNGSVVVIERSQEYQRVGEPGSGTGWLFDYAKVKAKLLTQDKEIVWHGRAQPLVLDLDQDGQIHLLATMETAQGRREYEVPNGTFYVAFRLEGDTWVRIALDKFPKNMRPNLLASTWRLFIKQQEPSGSLVKLSVKQTLDRDPTLGERYRTLVNLK